MEEFLRYVICELTEYPDEVVITKSESSGTVTFRVGMRKTDLGRIIGRGGHTIHALRNLLQASAAKHKMKKVFLEIIE